MRKKHYLIIGGTRGIGKTLVTFLAKKGHKVSVISRRMPIIDKDLPNVRYFLLDLAGITKLRKTIDTILRENGKISHLIFCQRYRGTGDPWEGELAVSLGATKTIIELVSAHFDETQERSIVVISSLSSFLVGLEQPLGYHIAKAGLNQLVRYFAVTLGPKGIRVNAIAPCTILKDESKQWYLKNTKLHNLYKKIIPIGRMGTAGDIANIIEFLCRPDSMFITGQTIVADGGLSLLSQDTLARNLSSLDNRT